MTAATAAATTVAAAPQLIPSPPPFSWAAVVSGQAAGAPASPRAHAKSFHNVFNKGIIKPKTPSTFKGEPAVFFSKDEISSLAAPFRFTLIGKFMYRRPTMEPIRKFFSTLELKSLKSVGLLHEKHIAIFITQEEDYARLLLHSTWYVSGAPMKVFKWSPDFCPHLESPVVPIWVGFLGLPLHLFEKTALFSLASVFGSPLKIDEPTALLSRPSVARVYIEVDVSKNLNHRLWVGREKDGFWQDVVFENPPLYCNFCKALGHEEKLCFLKFPTLKSDRGKQNKEKAIPGTSGGKNPQPSDSVMVVSKTPMECGKNIAVGSSSGNPSNPQNATAKEADKCGRTGILLQGLTLGAGVGKAEGSSFRKPTPPQANKVAEDDREENQEINVGEHQKKALEEAIVPPLTSGFRIPTAKSHVDAGKFQAGVVDSSTRLGQVISAGIALTPFPDLSKIKDGKGNKSRDEDGSITVPYLVKEKEFALTLPDVQSQPLSSNSNKHHPSDPNTASELFFNREEENEIQPLDEVGLQMQPLDCYAREL